MASKNPLYSYQWTPDEVSNVVCLLEVCGFPQERWHELGLTLGLHKDTLDDIKKLYDTTDDCLTECLFEWLSRADEEELSTFGSLLDALKSMNENAAPEKLKEESLWLLKHYSGGIAETGCALNSLPDAPEEGLDPMTVTTEVLNIAEKMKKDAEQKLKTNFTTFTPLCYIKKGETDYCIRVMVDNGKIDICGQYCAGSVMRIKVKHVTEDDDQTFF